MGRTLLILSLLLNLAACGKGFHKDALATRHLEAQEVDSSLVNEEFFELVNKERAIRRLAPLLYSPIIETIAMKHSRGMARKSRRFGHMGVNQRCRQVRNRLAPSKSCEELLAFGQKNLKELLNLWLSANKDRNLLIHPFVTHAGLGMFKDSLGVMYWTLIIVELK